MDAMQREFEVFAVVCGMDLAPDDGPSNKTYANLQTAVAYHAFRAAWQARPTGGVEAMREACAKVCDGFADDRECASVGATLAADKIRALPLPACDGVEAKRVAFIDATTAHYDYINGGTPMGYIYETTREGLAWKVKIAHKEWRDMLAAERGRDAQISPNWWRTVWVCGIFGDDAHHTAPTPRAAIDAAMDHKEGQDADK